MLITTGVKLELLQDIDQLLFFERGIRGGINGLGALRHFEANNNILKFSIPKRSLLLVLFFDVASLYAGKMQKEMPVGGYQWCTEVSLAQIRTTPSDSGFGYPLC